MRHQAGYVYRKGGAWYVRYSEAGRQRAYQLGRIELIKSKSAARLLADQFLAPINAGRGASAMTLEQFAARVYLPAVQQHKRISTYCGYRNLWLRYLSPHGALPLRDFHTADIERILAEVAQQHRLNVTSVAHLKAFLSGLFLRAKRDGLVLENPVHDAEPPQAPPARETYAYSLEEILRMIELLPEPAATIAALAAFTGLRKGEIRGLQWQDYEDGQLYVRRSYWRGHCGEPKTLKSRAPVPVIASLAARLARYAETQAVDYGERLIFHSLGKKYQPDKPINLERLAVNVIRPALAANPHVHARTCRVFTSSHEPLPCNCRPVWHGWHAFRRGLASNLRRLGVADTTIQRLLRHSSVAVTQANYIKTVDADVRSALQLLPA